MFDFEIVETKTGLGLITKRPFKKGQVILKFEGKQVDHNEIQSFTKEKADGCLEFDLKRYLLINDHNSYFINHSCSPNCLIKVSVNQVFLLALVNINVGDELFFDYSTTSSDPLEDFNMECNCGNKHQCRKNISGFQTVPKFQQDFYLQEGALPDFIIKYFGLNQKN